MEFIEDLSTHLRAVEQRKFGRAHPQTVSLFGPELKWRAHMKMEQAIYRHPSLDFATIHIYEEDTIDDPRNTVDAAIGMGRIVRESLAQIDDLRPFLDSEHGPIHSFKDHKRTLPEAFDDEYFRHMQWAHLASGGTGGGMRWPNRKPHNLTAGMRQAQGAMARFLPLLDWSKFTRRNTTDCLELCDETGRSIPERRVARFSCGTEAQALIYLLRRDALLRHGQLDREAAPLALTLRLPLLKPGSYRVTRWDTVAGAAVFSHICEIAGDRSLRIPQLIGDMAIAIRSEA